MRLLMVLVDRSWPSFLASGLFTAVAGLSYAAIVTIIGSCVRNNGGSLLLACALVGACLLYVVARLMSNRFMVKMSQTALLRLRLDLCRRVLATPQEALQQLGRHRLLAILTQDVDTLSAAYNVLPSIFSWAVTTIACLVYMGWLYWPLLVIFPVVLLAGGTTVRRLRRKPMRDLAAMRERIDGLYAQIRNLIDGSRELQLNSRRGRHYVENVISASATGIRSDYTRSVLRFSTLSAAADMVYFCGIAAVLFMIPSFAALPPGALAGIAITMLFMGPPLAQALQAMPIVGRAQIALDKIRQLEAQLPADGGEFQASPPTPTPASVRIELRGIRHRHQTTGSDRHFGVGPVDLAIESGEIVFLVGGNGSGKTTLAMLILGLYRADEGDILINGVALSEATRSAYRQHFSAVLADFHLFEEVGDDGRHDLRARAQQYLVALRMEQKVRVEGGLFSTTSLSSGQRKRLALVSAYLEDRPVYLFDEWASDQDPEFKRVFYTQLLPELKAAGKAVIVITHDDRYFASADRVIRLEEGMAIEVPCAPRERHDHAAALI